MKPMLHNPPPAPENLKSAFPDPFTETVGKHHLPFTAHRLPKRPRIFRYRKKTSPPKTHVIRPSPTLLDNAIAMELAAFTRPYQQIVSPSY